MISRFLCILLLASFPLAAEVKVAALFADGMVVQRESAVTVWGTATVDEPVTVSFRGRIVQATASGGKWLLRIEGGKVRVWSRDVPKPVAVRYAWASNPILSVENQAGLPLQPFRTDRLR